jgi:hypothetical protein
MMAGFRKSLIVGRDAGFFVKAVGSGTFTGTATTVYVVKITTAGKSGSAKATVYDTSGVVVNAEAAVTSASAITLGAVGARLTLTWSGCDLRVGMTWYVFADVSTGTATVIDEPDSANNIALRPVAVNSDGEMLVKMSGDIELGAVELKDGASDARAVINAANTARAASTVVVAVQGVDAAGAVLSTSGLALEAGGNLADVKTSVQLIDDSVGTVGSAAPTKGLLSLGSDGTNARALLTTATGAQAVKGDAPAAVTSTIAAEGTTSPDWLDVRGYTPLFGTDVAFAGTDFTFLHSFNGTDSAGVLKDGDGSAVTLTGAATTVQTIVPTGNDAIALAAAFYIKIVKTTAQGAATPTVITVGKSA